MENGHILPLLQYVVSLAIIEAIKIVYGSKGFPYLDVRIKWPNDLYLNGLKVEGILREKINGMILYPTMEDERTQE
ncbi:hypothetical protein QJS10_CPA03g01901 [Acorus calamus]|uniref:BPL/LPL catalytic domain-containing protein n=1 Tax=Acorus calamus TaxID=4465 RepID=A0AAV9F9X1_ACOCL|nr:hypothetical protein QJS10_CPA03g01901 [Acorus calamus]